MLFLGVPTGYYDYLLISILTAIIVIILLIVGLYYLYKIKAISRGSALPVLCVLSMIFIPVLIMFLPYIFGGWDGGFVTANIILWIFLVSFIVAFIIFMYLVRSKKRIIEETQLQTPEGEEQRIPKDTGLVAGAVFAIILALIMIPPNLFILSPNTTLPALERFLSILIPILVILLSIVIVVGNAYSIYRKKFSSMGKTMCLIGSISLISAPIYYALMYEFFFFGFFEIISIISGVLVILGVIIDLKGNNFGSKLCIIGGVISVIVGLPIFSFTLSFFTVWFIQIEPFLIIIGGYLLYQELIRN